MPPNSVGPEGDASVGPPPGRIESLKQGFWSKLDKARGIVPTQSQTQAAQQIGTGLASGAPPEQVLEGLAQPGATTEHPSVWQESVNREVADPGSALFTRFDKLDKSKLPTDLTPDMTRLQELLLKQKSNNFLPGELAELASLITRLDATMSRIENPNPFGEVGVAPDTLDNPHGEIDKAPDIVEPHTQEEVAAPSQETLTPLAERPNLPKNILADKQFDRDWLRLYREEYKRLEAAGTDIPQDIDDQIANAAMARAAELYYDRFADQQLNSPERVALEIKKDPLYKDIAIEVMDEASAKGELVDPKTLNREILVRYQKQKDLHQEQAVTIQTPVAAVAETTTGATVPAQTEATPNTAQPVGSEAQIVPSEQVLQERITELEQQIAFQTDKPELSAQLTTLMQEMKNLMETAKTQKSTPEQKVFNDKFLILLSLLAQLFMSMLQSGAETNSSVLGRY